MSPGRFVAGIAALVRRCSDGKYLLLRRAAERSYGAGVWECVTGRLEQREAFEEALRREVKEEIGITIRVEAILGTSHFYRGMTTPENEVVGVVYLCVLEGSQSVSISGEHSEYCWVDAAESEVILVDDHPGTDWLRRVIERAELHCVRARIPETTMRNHGFELN